MGATFFVTGVQLEIGNGVSPYETASHAEELAQCQRYFEALGGTNKPTRIGDGFTAGNETILAKIPYCSPKRAVPTVRFSGDEFVFVTESSVRPISTMEVIGMGPSALFLSGKSPGTQAIQDGFVQVSGMSKISLSAEI